MSEKEERDEKRIKKKGPDEISAFPSFLPASSFVQAIFARRVPNYIKTSYVSSMLGLGYTEYAYTTKPRNKTLRQRLARMFPVISHEQATYYFP